ncbi:MAG: HD domain-containing protein [Ruminiclostridium sp.]
MMFWVIEKMMVYFGNDVRRINHALKVYGFAFAISGMEHMSEKEAQIIGLAAVLHDIGIKEAERKYNSTAGKFQEIEGPPIAKQILENNAVESEIIDRVCYLIGNHHSYQKIDGLDFQILIEADFLVNIFETNIDKNAIESIRTKYFKTKKGTELLATMYLV